MKVRFSPGPASRDLLRTDGALAPIHGGRPPSTDRQRRFMGMPLRRLLWLLFAATGAVLWGGLLNQALAASNPVTCIRR